MTDKNNFPILPFANNVADNENKNDIIEKILNIRELKKVRKLKKKQGLQFVDEQATGDDEIEIDNNDISSSESENDDIDVQNQIDELFSIDGDEYFDGVFEDFEENTTKKINPATYIKTIETRIKNLENYIPNYEKSELQDSDTLENNTENLMETLYYFSEESLNAHFKNVMNSNQNNNKKNKNIEEELNIYDFTDVLCKNNDNKKTYIDNMLTNIFTLEKLITAYPLASQLEPRLNLVDFEDFFYNLTPYSNLKLNASNIYRFDKNDENTQSDINTFLMSISSDT